MIIEILEKGGIYGYYLKEECVYVGKTTRSFEERDREHKIGTSSFDIFYQQNPNLNLKILFDINFCNITPEQLDYLETSFIKALNPRLNQKKIKQEIQYNNHSTEKNTLLELTKSEQKILNILYNSSKKNITKKEIESSLKSSLSEKTIRRTLKHFCELNILKLKYTNGSGENIYEIIGEYYGN